MADTEKTSRSRQESASIGEVVDYVKTYARQETLGPLRGAGRWLAYGAAGALALGVGLFFLLLGLLRLLQTEWDRSARGSLSWLAYVIVLAVGAIVLAVTLMRINRSSLNKKDK